MVNILLLLHKQLTMNLLTSLLSFIIFLVFLYKWFNRKTVGNKNLPPSPPKLPILGNLHQLGAHPHRFLMSLSKQYGELMLIHIGSAPVVVVSSARAAHEILVKNDVVFANRPISKKTRKLLYNARDVASAPYGDHWKNMRSICVLHVLSNKMVRSFRSVREEETALVIDKIEQSSTLPVNLSQIFADFAKDVVCRVALGRTYGENEHGFNFNEVIMAYMKVLGEFNIGDFVPWLAFIDTITGWDAKIDKIVKDFDQFVEIIIKEHRDKLENYEGGDNEEKVKDFVDVLIDLQKDKSARFELNNENIKSLILDMFTGGTDTTSALLEWIMSELFRHPHVMQKLQNEVREISREKSGVCEEDLEQMKYLKAVIKETLRLHPTAPMLAPRESTQDTIICGYHIPAGTAIATNGWAIHRDPTFWDEPEKFYPDRFLNSAVDYKGHDFQFIPFGAGRRICPGMVFGIADTELMLAKLIDRFDWALPDGAERGRLDMTEVYGLTMHRKTPLMAVPTSYTGSS